MKAPTLFTVYHLLPIQHLPGFAEFDDIMAAIRRRCMREAGGDWGFPQFASRTMPTVYGGRLIVTYMDFGTDRYYSVRFVSDDGDLHTIGPRHSIPNLTQAVAVARKWGRLLTALPACRVAYAFYNKEEARHGTWVVVGCNPDGTEPVVLTDSFLEDFTKPVYQFA